MKTLITDLWAGQVRGSGPNLATRISRVAGLPPFDLRTLFERSYPAFAARCRAEEQPGLAILAVDETSGRAMGLVCLRAQVNRHVTAIVGRHDHCDLFVPGSDQLALRQLAVVLGPVTDWSAGATHVSYRILDLRTATGMTDEQARPLRGLRSEGPAMVRCGGCAIFTLPLGDPSDWPASASDAWALLPERVYHDELVRVPDASVVRPRQPARDDITLITRIPGPRELASSVAAGRDIAGHLRLEGPSRSLTLDVGTHALRDGVLLGRYDRCDGSILDLGDSVSRVHALLVTIDDRLLLIDTGSSNGTRVAGHADARVIEVEHDAVLELGDSTRVRWRWAS